MIPATLVGLVVFAASLGPGYVWVRAVEQRRARPERTPLLEAAELIFVGGLASTVSFLVVLTLGDWLGAINAAGLAEDGSTYVLANPGRAIGSFLVALLLAYVGAWLVAQLWHWRTPPTIQHGHSVWHTMLAPSGPAAAKAPFLLDRLPYVTVGRRDGTAVAGWPYAYTVEPAEPGQRELVLATPLRVRARGETEFIAREEDEVLAGILKTSAPSRFSITESTLRRFPGAYPVWLGGSTTNGWHASTKESDEGFSRSPTTRLSRCGRCS